MTARVQVAAFAIAAVAAALALFNLEQGHAGLELTQYKVGTTPVSLYRRQGTRGPVVVVAHGFAGSRQLMDSYSLSLASAGYLVLAYDLEGHGRNQTPMSGELTSVDGTTALLVAEAQRIIAAGRALDKATDGIALLGHSMATDIIIRAAQAEANAGREVTAIVAVSAFSEAVTSRFPKRLLIITGQWESRLRTEALEALRQVDPTIGEGDTARSGTVMRRAAVAPGVEHVGVLYSETAIREAQAWLDNAFGRTSNPQHLEPRGLWILTLLFAIVMLFKRVALALPQQLLNPITLSNTQFCAACLVPGIAVPLAATTLYEPFMPVLVADYLLIHLALYGALQWLLMGGRKYRIRLDGSLVASTVAASWAVLALIGWGIGVFGFALDRYAASFVPTPERLLIVTALCLGTVPFMLADSMLTQCGRAPWWRRVAARVTFMASLAVAAVLDPDHLTFVVIVLPVILLFFLVYGLMGRWVAQRCGPLPVGIGLGICLAWALGVSFPLFAGS